MLTGQVTRIDNAQGGYDPSVVPEPPDKPLGLVRFLRTVRDNRIAVFSARAFNSDLVEAKVLFQRFVILNHPDYIKHVLVDNHANYLKGRLAQKILSPLLGNGLLTSEGDYWRRQRRIVAPAFHHKRIARLSGVIGECGLATVERWRRVAQSREAIDILPEMMGLTMEIIGKALFSRDLGPSVRELGDAVSIVINDVGKGSPIDFVGLPEWLPRRRSREAKTAVALLEGTIYGIITARRASRETRDDLLAMLLEARDEATGEGMTDHQLRDEIMTLFAAGHETTGVALTWIWYLLSQHPAVEYRLHTELDRVLRGRTPDVNDLDNLPYTRMVVEEAMRLFPPAFAIVRVAVSDDMIGGHHIRAGTLVTISPYLVHRNPKIWPDPTRFEPERFTPARVSGRHRFSYLPFGGGPRICIGNNLAMMEVRILLAVIAQAFRLRLAPGHRVEAQGRVTLRPRYGMRMTLEPRIQSTVSDGVQDAS